jgi:hypothetical protein
MAQRLRDDVLDGTSMSDLLPPLRKWARRVRRSRTLRWSLAGIGSTSDMPRSLAGDALARLCRWLDAATGAHEEPAVHRHETQWTVDNLPSMLVGTELANARLLVASLDPDLDLVARSEIHHG